MAETESRGTRRIQLYVAAVSGVAAAIIFLLLVLYIYRIPAFTNALVQNPISAVQQYPVAVVLVIAILAGIVLLLALIVGFGARYGLQEPNTREENKSQ